MGINLLNDPLYRAVAYLERSKNARMTDKTRLGDLLIEFGGSYTPGNTEKLRVAGVSVSCTGGTGNLLSAWKRKAEDKLNAATEKAGA